MSSNTTPMSDTFRAADRAELIALHERYTKIVKLMLNGEDVPTELLPLNGNVPWTDVRFRHVFRAETRHMRNRVEEGRSARVKWDGMKELAAALGAAMNATPK